MQSLTAPVRIISLILILFLISIHAEAQKIDLREDMMLIDSLAKKQMPQTSKKAYIYKDQPKTIKNSNPVSMLYGGSLYVYQNFITQHFSANCLYHPTCSDFSKQAVKNFGLIKGGLLTFDRLNRCNRIAATDLDPATLNKKTQQFNDPVNLYK